MKICIIIALIWMAVGLLSYATIMLVYPPTPLILDSSRENPELESVKEDPEGRPFRLSDIPAAIEHLTCAAVFSPFLLLAIVITKICKRDR